MVWSSLISFCLHPQLCVLPLRSEPAIVCMIAPQLHLHRQMTLSRRSDSARSITVNRPIRCPVRSMKRPISTLLHPADSATPAHSIGQDMAWLIQAGIGLSNRMSVSLHGEQPYSQKHPEMHPQTPPPNCSHQQVLALTQLATTVPSIFYPLFAYGTRFLQLDLGSGASSLVPPSSQSTNMPRQVISITSGSSKVDQSTPSFGSGVFSLMGHDGQFKQYSDMVGWVLGSLAAGAAGIRLAVCGDGGGMGERLHSAPSSFSAIPIIH